MSMESTMSVDDKSLPEEIIHQILLRLPVKSVLRSTAVCKSWRSLVRSSNFINAHISRCTTIQDNGGGDQLLLLHALASDKFEDSEGFYSLLWDRSPSFSEYSKLVIGPLLDYAYEILTTPTTITRIMLECFETKIRLEVVGTSNGLVCLHDDCFLLGEIISIWNPCIRKFVILPPPNFTKHIDQFAYHAFCYDSRSNDYKVLRSVTVGKSPFSCEVEIWSLARGSWKSLDPPDPAGISISAGFRCVDFAFVNGALHWIQFLEAEIETGDHDIFILSFDVFTESFGKILMPPKLKLEHSRSSVHHISTYGESIAFLNSYRENNSHFWDMWVMEKYGAPETWTKLFTLRLRPRGFERPICFRKSGEVVWRYSIPEEEEEEDEWDNDIAYESLDPKTEQVFPINAFQNYYRIISMDYFVESVALLNQPNAISY